VAARGRAKGRVTKPAPPLPRLKEHASAGRHPFVQGLLHQLPAEGSAWPLEERAKWLRAAAMVFELLHTTHDTGTITIRVTSEAS
jgi:hypothetical protein